MFNKRLLRAKVIEKGKTLGDVAAYLNINPATLTRKMSGESDFTRNEIQNIKDFLDMSSDEVDAIFFA